jgi:uncharacterized protein involved in oxidation of intracellular sulfur
MSTLFILNDPPYGAERVYNALRIAGALPKSDPAAPVIVFLMADAVTAARSGQKTSEGHYNVELMLKRVIAASGEVILCGTCMNARGLTADQVMPGARRGTMDELARATVEAEKVLVF